MSTPASPRSAVENPVAALRRYGQSVWLDFIRRSLIAGGELKRLVDEDGLGGVTSGVPTRRRPLPCTEARASPRVTRKTTG